MISERAGRQDLIAAQPPVHAGVRGGVARPRNRARGLVTTMALVGEPHPATGAK
jgi:hypothetical protein